METSDKRRDRFERKSTGKRVTPQPRDIAMFEWIERHGPSPSHILYAATKHLCKNETRHRERLGDLFHEDNTPAEGPYLERPWQQRRSENVRYQSAVYELNERSQALLRAHGRHQQFAVPVGGGYEHRIMTAMITGMIELAIIEDGRAREAEGKPPRYRFICQEEILRSAPKETRAAKNPLEIPVSLSYAFSKRDKRTGYETRETRTSKKPLDPDALFGIEYLFPGQEPKSRFFALEADRGTEQIWKDNLNEVSILRKILGYRDIAAHSTYESHFGIKNMLPLFITTSEQRKLNMMECVKEVTTKPHGKYGSTMFLFAAMPEFGPFLKVPPISPALFLQPYTRVGHPTVSLADPEW